MRERLLLFFILFGLGVFLYIFQNHIDTTKGFVVLCACMVVYGLYSIAATKYQIRKNKKYPPIINKNYKPFVSVLIPAHNEEGVIANTVENILTLDYPNFEIIVIDDAVHTESGRDGEHHRDAEAGRRGRGGHRRAGPVQGCRDCG